MPSPQVISLPLNLNTLPPLYRRGQHVLILVRDLEDRLIVGKKDIYPENISRMVGGGLDPYENPVSGAARELAEELHIIVSPHQLVPLAIVTADITHQAEKIQFTTWLYFYQLKQDEQIQPDDDLDGVVHLTIPQLEALIQRYSQLQAEYNHEAGFAWQDYGALYGPMHQIALDRALDII